uniref:Uncharacterized protein n=1 Tax=Arundo donax TaxID=35708 RepID=A0A0A9EJL4_ARUDO
MLVTCDREMKHILISIIRNSESHHHRRRSNAGWNTEVPQQEHPCQGFNLCHCWYGWMVTPNGLGGPCENFTATT